MGLSYTTRLSAACLSLLTAGCAQVDLPDHAALTEHKAKQAHVETAEEARAYIGILRAKMIAEQDDLGRYESLGDAAMAGGTITAVLGGALGWATHTVIGASVGAGTGAAFNQVVNPRAQAEILDGGITALNCIDDKAEDAYRASARIDEVLQPVKKALQTLRAIPDVGDPNTPQLKAEAAAKTDAVSLAQAFVTAHTPSVYTKVRTTANTMVATTNAQLRKAVADPNAFAQAFQKISATPATVAAKAEAQSSAFRNAEVAAITANTALTDETKKLIVALLNAKNTAEEKIAKIEADTPSVVADFSACVPGAVLLVANPSGPITFKSGSKFNFTVTGGPHGWAWDGVVPNDVTARPIGSNQYEITANSGITAEKQYWLVFTPFAQGTPLKVQVVVKP